MRQVIGDSSNASLRRRTQVHPRSIRTATISTNSTIIWRIDLEAGSYQVMFPAITFAIISRGSQSSKAE